MSEIINFLKKPNGCHDLIEVLEDAIEQPDPTRRTKAREQASLYNKTVHSKLVQILYPDLTFTALALNCAEKGYLVRYQQAIRKRPAAIGLLQEICSIDPLEECRATGKIHVSKETFDIIWPDHTRQTESRQNPDSLAEVEPKRLKSVDSENEGQNHQPQKVACGN